MTRQYTKYPKEHIEIIKPFLLLNIINRVPVREIAEKLEMNYATLKQMMNQSGIKVINVRHGYEEIK